MKFRWTSQRVVYFQTSFHLFLFLCLFLRSINTNFGITTSFRDHFLTFTFFTEEILGLMLLEIVT